MRWVWRLLLCFSVLVAECIVALKFSSVTESVRLTDAYGKIVDFADFNADKATDVLVQNRAGSNYSLYLWSSHRRRFQRHSLALQNGSSLVFTAGVDLDGDGRVDILSLFQEEEECHTLGVHWMGSQGGRPVADSYQVIDSHVLNPPLVLDANGDHVPDVMVQSCRADGERRLWISERRELTLHPLPLATPLNHTTAYYVDLNSDYLADVVMDGWSSGVRSLAYWERTTSCSSTPHLIPPLLPVPLPRILSRAAVSSRLAFADMDADGRMEAVAYSCSDPACTDVQVHILSPERSGGHHTACTASTHPVNFTQVHTVSLPTVSIPPHTISSTSPVIGDVDLDGYPDIVVPTNKSSDLLLLVARQCHTHCNGSGVTLDPQWVGMGGRGGGGGAGGEVTAAAFFDLWEDGILDILLTQQGADGDQLLAYRQDLRDDHAFLKVLVLSGHCFHDCTSGQEPYGSVLPGAVVSFSTTDRLGRRKRSIGTVHAGLAHQLPFLVFGLGQTPNLVEQLEVGALGGGRAAHHSWRNLVPNSQVIVIPSPPARPERWRMELYLTPGELVYSTAGVLAALFVGTAIVVLLLQAREKYQDSRERKKAKHKFHFNAM